MLSKKLGVAPGGRILPLGAPADYRTLLAPLPDGVRFVRTLSANTDIVHLFTKRRAELARRLATLRNTIRPDATVWVSWPKKAAKVQTDVTEDVIRDIALPLGFVDVKVCAVDATWSGLKLVIRKVNR